MSDIEQVEDTGVPVDGLAAQLTDSVGVPDDADESTALPNALAERVEEYDGYRQDMPQPVDQPQSDDGEQTEQVEQQAQRKHVPLGALQEERQKRQQAQEQARQLQAQLAEQQAQLQQFQAWQAQQATQQQQVEQIPDFADDPEGHVKALAAQFEQRLAAVQGEQHQRQEFEQASRQIQQDAQAVMPFLAQVEPAFRAAHADYDEAREFVHANIRAQLQARHPGATAEQIQGLETLAQLSFVKHCHATGIDPCAHVYQRAQQLGFQTQHRAPRRAAPTSLSNLPASGKAPDQRGTPKASDIAAMSNQQFDELFESMRASSVQHPWG